MDTIGQDPAVSKSNQLHVKAYSIDFSHMIGNSSKVLNLNWSFLKFKWPSTTSGQISPYTTQMWVSDLVTEIDMLNMSTTMVAWLGKGLTDM